MDDLGNVLLEGLQIFLEKLFEVYLQFCSYKIVLKTKKKLLLKTQ